MASPRETADTAPVTAEAAAKWRSTAARHSRTAAKESVWAAANRGDDCRCCDGVSRGKAEEGKEGAGVAETMHG